MRNKTSRKNGFTLIELTFALTFISILLLTIGFLTIHITATYQKGLSIKTINASGRSIIDDISRAIASTPPRTVQNICLSQYEASSTAYTSCINDNARKLIYQQRYGKVKIKTNGGSTEEYVPTNGVLCTGQYSYIWNTAYAINNTDYEHLSSGSYRGSFKLGSNSTQEYKLLKLTDVDRKLCREHMLENTYAYDDNPIYELSITPSVHVELLDQTNSSTYAESDIALYDFTVFAPTVHNMSSSGFYSAAFVLATLRGGININATGNFCSDPPDGISTDFAYCAINKFNFAIQAFGEKK